MSVKVVFSIKRFQAGGARVCWLRHAVEVLSSLLTYYTWKSFILFFFTFFNFVYALACA